MQRRNFLLALASVTALGACADKGTVKQTGSDFVAPPGKALVVFYRPAAFAGSGIRFNVQHTEGAVGQLTSGYILQKVVNPGTNTFWSQVISQDSVTIDAQPGQTYFVRGDVRMGLYAGRPTFTRVSEAQARREMAG